MLFALGATVYLRDLLFARGSTQSRHVTARAACPRPSLHHDRRERVAADYHDTKQLETLTHSSNHWSALEESPTSSPVSPNLRDGHLALEARLALRPRHVSSIVNEPAGACPV